MIENIKNIPNFNNIYNSVYNEVKSRLDKNDIFIIVRSKKVREEFEKKFNVKTLNTKNNTNGITGYEFDDVIYPFDSIDFLTEENKTMCLLKWTR